MSEQPALNTVTSTSLLAGLQDHANRTVWQQFAARYQPMLVRYGRRLGLSDADAEDAAQQTLIAFSQSYREGKYDPLKGRLRVWLFGIARNQVRNLQRKVGRQEQQVVEESQQTGFFARLPDDDRFEQIWEEEWRDAVLRQCLTEVAREFDDRTVQAFELFAWRGQSAQEVADQLGMSPNAVFIAKHRVMKRIRALLPAMEEIW
ncbi:MAG TPA: sigma-70 family RNA polymerase sigma factor [Phycisphaerae bacterium]|nr:sigma-70 family RNA polymerase sigma factor [Phycisphaerae bacterium]